MKRILFSGGCNYFPINDNTIMVKNSGNIISFSGGFLVKSKRFLLGKRSDNKAIYPGVWDMFGGHIEPEEKPVEALKREFTEELGINPICFDLFDCIEHYNIRHGKALVYIYFITQWEGGKPAIRNQEHSEIKWFYRPELDLIPLASYEYLNIIDAWQKR